MRATRRLLTAAAVLALGACATMNVQEAQSHLKRGDDLEKIGRLDEAVAQYRQAVAADPSLQEAHFALAVGLYDLYQKELGEDAVREFQKAVDLAPQDAGAHYGLAVALADYGLKQEALDQYHMAVRLDPKYKTLYLKDVLKQRDQRYAEPSSSLGDMLLRDWDAPQSTQPVSVSRTESARKQVEYGRMLGGMGELSKAVQEYQRASESDPSFAEAFYSLGMADLQAGNTVEAATLLKRYLELEDSAQYPDKDHLKKARSALDGLSNTP